MQQNTKKKQDVLGPINRVLVLGHVEIENINQIIEQILLINEEDTKKKTKSKPIKLIINSPGGDVYAALGLIDVMDNSITPIHTICYGHAMSAGFFIFLKGHERYTGKLATFMYHDISSYYEESVTTLKREIKECERLVEIVDDIVVKNSNIQLDYLDNIKEHHINKYFTAQEALELGIVDEIL